MRPQKNSKTKQNYLHLLSFAISQIKRFTFLHKTKYLSEQKCFVGFFLPCAVCLLCRKYPSILKNSSVHLEVVKTVRIKKGMYLLKGLLQCCPHICSLHTLPALKVSCQYHAFLQNEWQGLVTCYSCSNPPLF